MRGLALLGAFAAAPVGAADDIRVLLAQDVQRADIASDQGLLVRFDGGAAEELAGPITVLPTPDGKILVNGVSSLSLDVAAARPGQDLTVGLNGLPNGAQPWVVGGRSASKIMSWASCLRR
jgi:hypothetical protein